MPKTDYELVEIWGNPDTWSYSDEELEEKDDPWHRLSGKEQERAVDLVWELGRELKLKEEMFVADDLQGYKLRAQIVQAARKLFK